MSESKKRKTVDKDYDDEEILSALSRRAKEVEVRENLVKGRSLAVSVAREENFRQDIVSALQKIPSNLVVPKYVPKKKVPVQRILNLLWSDLHFHALLDPREVPIAYGPKEEARRLAALCVQAAEYKRDHRDETALVINLAGDIIQGQLHDPRDGAPLAEQFAASLHLLKQAIGFLAGEFKEVLVTCTPGNHGRNTARHKDRAVLGKYDSYENMLYSALKTSFLQIPNVKFDIPYRPYIIYNAFDKKILVTHGDTMINPGNPGSNINVASIKAQTNAFNAQRPDKDKVSLFCVGHVHTASLVHLGGDVAFMSNGALIPVDSFAQCLHQDTILVPCGQKPKPIKEFKPGDKILGVDDQGQTIETEVVALHDNGIKEGLEITFDDGYQVVCTPNHKFLTSEGMVPMKDIVDNNLEIFNASPEKAGWMDSLVRSKISNPETNCRTPNYMQGMQGDLQNKEIGRMEKVATGVSGSGKSPRPKIYSEVASLGNQQSNPISRNFEEKREESSAMGCRSSGTEGYYQRQTIKKPAGMARTESSKITGLQPTSSRRSRELEKDKSCSIPGVHKESYRGEFGLARSESRNFSGQSSESSDYEQGEFKTGEKFERLKSPELARSEDSMWRKIETDRFCQPGSQNLGGSGWAVSLLRDASQEWPHLTEQSVPGQDAERRSSETQGRDADSSGYAMLQKQQANKTRMVDLAHAHAPLSNTGGLVCRRVVRVRPVGPKRMYDLEVAHPKHNFLLPNGIVTSNSIGIFNSTCGQQMFESVPGKVVGDTRFVVVDENTDKDKSLDKIITPFTNF